MSKKSKITFTNRPPKLVLPGYMASANCYMKKIGFERIINEALEWDEKQWNVSPGALLKAVVLNTFTNRRAPLYKIGKAYANIDTEYLFGEGVTSDKLTDAAIGEALERLYKANAGNIFKTLSLTVFKKFDLPIKRLHSDTTSISFFGQYDEESTENTTEERKPIDITYGHNKDHRPDCKQMVLGQISNEAGIMLNYKCMDGNTSDVTWNKEALQLIEDIQKEHEKGNSIYVADCKLMTKTLFETMTDNDKVLFISRVPANFDSKLESRIRMKAYENNNWEEIGKISSEKKGCTYEIQSFTEDVYGVSTRLIAVKSSASLASFEASQKKKKIQIEKRIKEVNKRLFACEEDAKNEWKIFCKTNEKAPYIFSTNLEKIETEKKPRGNPGKIPKPPVIKVQWALNIKLDKEDQTAMKALREKAESFVIISNVPDSISTASMLLAEYKGQIVVELNFKTMKSPALTSTVFLEKEERIESLMMLICVSLMIRALILYNLREGFKDSGDQLKIGYTGGTLKTITMGLFEFAMDSLTIVREYDGTYLIYVPEGKTPSIFKFGVL